MMIGRETVGTALRATLVAAVVAAGVIPVSGAAQVADRGTDSRWLPWLGCWEASVERSPRAVAAEGAMLCVRPVRDDRGVEFLTVTDGRIAATERVRADGTRYEAAREGCHGWRRAEFSGDATRVYRFTDFVCDGDVERGTTGLMSMISPSLWVDVEAVEIEGETTAFLQRYRPASPERAAAVGLSDITSDRTMASRAARVRASRGIEVDDVIEATSRVHPEAVRVWVAEQDEALDLSAAELVRMDEAGVPGDVVDVVVAVSYPSRFDLGEGARVAEAEDEYMYGPRDRYAYDRPYYDPFYYDPFYYGFSRFSPFGYGRYGGFGFFPGYSPTVVVVDDDPPRRGRWVKGRGFTGGSASSGGSGSRGRAVRRGGARGSAGGSAVSRRGGSSGSATMTRSGVKRRGGSSTGRKAKKKGSGGGGGGSSGGSGGGGGLP